jgi:hypothetical protein
MDRTHLEVFVVPNANLLLEAEWVRVSLHGFPHISDGPQAGLNHAVCRHRAHTPDLF